jgi:hypothetical protein
MSTRTQQRSKSRSITSRNLYLEEDESTSSGQSRRTNNNMTNNASTTTTNTGAMLFGSKKRSIILQFGIPDNRAASIYSFCISERAEERVSLAFYFQIALHQY